MPCHRWTHFANELSRGKSRNIVNLDEVNRRFIWEGKSSVQNLEGVGII